jgi:major vault protein
MYILTNEEALLMR